MSVRDTGKVRETGAETSKIEQLSDSRENYSEGQPVSGDSYEEGTVSAAQSQTVGFKQVLPILNEKEAREIKEDLKDLAKGIEMYKSLPPEDQEEIELKKYAVGVAMLEAMRTGHA